MNLEFWRGKSVLITGHTGFKGSWLSLWLQMVGAQVTGYSLPSPTNPSFFELAKVRDGMNSIIGDILDVDHLKHTIDRHRTEIVFHLAAQALVKQGYRDPVGTFEANVLGTARVLEAIRQTGAVKVVVVVTSDKCYQNNLNSVAHKETDVLGGDDPYSSSKACAEMVSSAYHSSYFIRTGSHVPALATVRAGNVIGGGDWAQDRLLPDTMRALFEARPVSIRNPHAIRPWQHVLEPLGGYLLLAQRLWEHGIGFAEAWNFGPADEDAKPVEVVVQRVVELWGGGARWTRDLQAHPHESEVLKLDCRKARERLGWKPQWSLDEALERTVAWYKAYFRGQDVRSIATDQLDLYQSLAMETAE